MAPQGPVSKMLASHSVAMKVQYGAVRGGTGRYGTVYPASV